MSDDPVDRMVAEVAAAMERTMARLEVMYASLDTSALERIAVGQEKLRTDFLAELDRTRHEIMGQVAELKAQLRDDIAVHMGVTEAAQHGNDNMRAELRALGEQIQKQLQRVEAELRELKGGP
jgi:seryl-tRNA synthetase